ncbi:hypothetical protein, partial [Pseudomonas lurida]|uniref:hypothetical protein n=1 Tax=Pseudomonas lurida TaxID=244566 RepID=UPI001F2C7B7A
MLAKNSQTPRLFRQYALLLAFFASKLAPTGGSHCCCFGNSPCPESVFFIPLQGTILTGLSEQTIRFLEASLQ